MSDTSIFMFLTRSCNLACSHCYVSAEPRLKGHMSLDVFRRIVESFSAQGINDFRLTGGEPTIHPNFKEMLEILTSKSITPRLITNGICLMQMRSPETVLNKVSRCWISSYGINLQQHRVIGGERSLPLTEIMDFAGRQTKAGYWVGVSALLTETSLDALKDFVELAKKREVLSSLCK
jgi:MoaA/NifB/PqqE/SkfB family radical SAM enzyme